MRSFLEIIQSWKSGGELEYRGFRCGDCQRPIRKAWHITVKHKGRTWELHLCKKCGKKYNLKGVIQ